MSVLCMDVCTCVSNMYVRKSVLSVSTIYLCMCVLVYMYVCMKVRCMYICMYVSTMYVYTFEACT